MTAGMIKLGGEPVRIHARKGKMPCSPQPRGVADVMSRSLSAAAGVTKNEAMK
jgi:hypothetical protein